MKSSNLLKLISENQLKQMVQDTKLSPKYPCEDEIKVLQDANERLKNARSRAALNQINCNRPVLNKRAID